MGFQQDTIIYIDNQDKLDASAAANSFADKNVKNRAYINALGAELAIKYLASENVDVSGIYNIHSIKKILEEVDISDIMLPNIHIDVRVIFDENIIFIPKSHFNLNLVPDIYLVLNLAKDFSYVKFLGFFEPRLINKNNQNADYYFIEKEKLNPISDLVRYIKNFQGNTTSGTTEQDIENSERIIMAMADNDISENEKQYLIKQLTKSAELRDKFIEYENFETLSYKAMTDPQIIKKEIDTDKKENDSSFEIEPEELSQTENVETFDSIENFDNLEFETLSDFDGLNLDDVHSDNTDMNDETSLEFSENNELENTFENENSTEENPINNIDETNEENVISLDNPDLNVTKDILTDNATDAQTITFEDIDTSEFDKIQSEYNENYNEEIISFEGIENPAEQQNPDYIDEIDNKISLDDIDIANTLPEQSDNVGEETISFEDFNSSLTNENIDMPDENIDIVTNGETLNNPDLDINNLDIPNTDINLDESLQLDDSAIQLENLQIDQDDIQLPENSDIDVTNTAPDSIADTTSENTLETLDEIPYDEGTNEESDTDEQSIIGTSDNQSSETDTSNSYEDQPTDENSTFGKNLLENMSEENLNSINIDELGLEDIETSESQNADEISSDELLSQIDDLLGAKEEKTDDNEVENQLPEDFSNESDSTQSNSDTKEDTTVNTNTEDDTNIEIPDSNNASEDEKELEDIPDIDSIINSSDTILSSSPTEDLNSSDSEEQTVEELPESSQDTIDTSIDDLLNISENSDDIKDDSNLEDDKLGVLFNDTDPVSDTELDEIDTADFTREIPQSVEHQVPGAAFLREKKAPDKKTLITAAALITILAGTSAFVLLKPKSEATSDIESNVPVSSEIVNTPKNKQSGEENILETNAPSIDTNQVKKVQKTKQQVKELKNTAIANKKPISSESYLDVKRLVWDVPDVLSYSPKIQNYLKTAGKSIKLSLSADLLLATEYAYSNQVKVGLKLSKDGNVQDAKIISSSGSTEIDNIVLQSVKDTLNVVKPPSNEINTPDFNLNLIIYF